jgi:hypothetical protein
MHRLFPLLGFLVLGFVVCGFAFSMSPGTTDAQASGMTVQYPAGWNLISLPSGTGAATGGDLYHWLTNADDYETVTSAAAAPALGYWAFFPTATQLVLGAGSEGAYTITPRAGHFVMIGDPSGDLPATVSGADAVYVYDPVNGYQPARTLEPGQGAWAISLLGSTITITPQATLLPSPIAGTPSTAGTRTVSSTKGYSLVLPQDWRTIPARQAYEDQHWSSPDGTAEAGVFVLTPAVGAVLDPTQELNGFVGGLLQNPLETDVTVLSGPTPATVPNATAAATETVSYKEDGVARQDTYLVAVHGQTDYVLVVVLSGPYLSTPGLSGSGIVNSITNSFALTP